MLSKRETWIVAGSVSVKLVMFFLLFVFVGQAQWMADSDSNLVFAQNLYERGVLTPAVAPPYLPSAINTPGYPLFLMLTGLATGWVGYTILIQIALVTIAAVMLYRLLGRLFEETVAFWGALLFAIEPWNAFVTNFPLTEATFLFTFIAACYAFERALHKHSAYFFIASGLSLGAATMIRPIAQFVPLVFIAVLLVFRGKLKLSMRTALIGVGGIACAYALVIAPYIIRNYVVFDVATLSTKGPFTVYFYDVSMLLQYREGISGLEANARLFSAAQAVYPEITEHDQLMAPRYAHYLNERSFEEIARSPVLFIKLHLSSLATFFFSDGYRLILKYFGVTADLPNITFLILKGQFAQLFDYLRHNLVTALVFLGGVALWGSTSMLAFAAVPIAFFREKNARVRVFIYFFAALMVYFAGLTGLAAMARYRVPSTPFIFPLAAYSLFFIFSYLRGTQHRAMNHAFQTLTDKKQPLSYRYYYDDLRKFLSFVIPPDARVFRVRDTDPDVLPKEAGTHDYVVMLDTIGSVHDIEKVFKTARHMLHADGRLVLSFHNYLWEPLFALAEMLRLKAPSRTQSWLSPSDVRNLLYLSGFDVVRSGKRMLFPLYIPLLSSIVNALGYLPLINRLCITNYMIARPMPAARTEYSVSIVVPARNEKGNMRPIIERIPQFGTAQEVIFIEGHSKDGTWEEIQRIASTYTGPFSITTAQQDGVGKGDAVRKGFALAKNDVLMILDADMTVAPEDLPKFYDAIAQGKADFINGSRLVYPMEKQAMRFLNTLGNKFFAILFTWLLDQSIKDTLCGTKVLRKVQYEAIARNRAYFGDFDPFGDFDLLFGAVKHNLKIVDLPIRYRERTYGITQIHRFAHGWLLLQMSAFAARMIKFH